MDTLAPVPYLYARLSKRDQKYAGVERQLADITAAAIGDGYRPDQLRIFSERGSAWKPDHPRPQFEALMTAIETGGRQAAVYLYKLDRLSRQPSEMEQLIRFAQRHPISVRCSDDVGLDLTTASGIRFARDGMNSAAYESGVKSERVRRAKAGIRAQGRMPGGALPFGWSSGDQCCEQEAEIIRQTIEEVLSGKGLAAIARDWADRGVPHKGLSYRAPGGGEHQVSTQHHPWRATDIKRILLNPRHAGYLPHREAAGKVLVSQADIPPLVKAASREEGGWDPIVDPGKWRRAVGLLMDRASTWSRQPRKRALLTGQLVCSGCGQQLYRGRSPLRWGCRAVILGRIPKGAVEHVGIDAAQVEEYLLEVMFKAIAFGKPVRREADGLAAQELEDQVVTADVDELRARIADLWRREALPRSHADYVPEREIKPRIGRYEASIRVLLEKRQQATTAPHSAEHGGPEGARLLRQRWPSLSLDEQRTIYADWVPRMEILPTAPGAAGKSPARCRPARAASAWSASGAAAPGA